MLIIQFSAIVTMGSNSHLAETDLPLKPAVAGDEGAEGILAQCVGQKWDSAVFENLQ